MSHGAWAASLFVFSFTIIRADSDPQEQSAASLFTFLGDLAVSSSSGYVFSVLPLQNLITKVQLHEYLGRKFAAVAERHKDKAGMDAFIGYAEALGAKTSQFLFELRHLISVLSQNPTHERTTMRAQGR